MNRERRLWLDTVANARVQGTRDRVVVEHFCEERPMLQPLPAGRFDAVRRAERRVSHDGCVSVGGNCYGVPDGRRRRVLDVETTADQARILEDGTLIAVHALTSRPRLLLDEPSLGLSPLLVQEMAETLRQLAGRFDVTILLAEQNTRLALRIASRAYVLQAGRCVREGPSASLGADLRATYLGA